MFQAGHIGIATPRGRGGGVGGGGGMQGDQTTIASADAADIHLESPEKSFVNPHDNGKGGKMGNLNRYAARLQSGIGKLPFNDGVMTQQQQKQQEFTPILKSAFKRDQKENMSIVSPSEQKVLPLGRSRSSPLAQIHTFNDDSSLVASHLSGSDPGSSPVPVLNDTTTESSAAAIGASSRSQKLSNLTMKEQDRLLQEKSHQIFGLELLVNGLREKLRKEHGSKVADVLAKQAEREKDMGLLAKQCIGIKAKLVVMEEKAAAYEKEAQKAKDGAGACPLQHGMSVEEQEQLDHALKKNEELQDKIASIESEPSEDGRAKRLERQIEEQKDDCAQLEIDYTRVERERDIAYEDLDIMQNENKELKEKLSSQREDAEDELARLRSERDKFQEQIKALEEDANANNFTAGDVSVSNARNARELFQKLENAQQKLERQEVELEKAREEAATATQRFYSAKEELSNVKKGSDSLDAELQEFSQQLRDVKSQNDHLQGEVQLLKSERDNYMAQAKASASSPQLFAEVEKHKEALERLRSELATSKTSQADERERLEAHARTLESAKQNLHSRISRLEENKQQLEGTILTLEYDCKSLKTELNTSKQRNGSLEEEIRAVRAQHGDTTMHVQNQLGNVNMQLENARHELDKKQKEIEDLQQTLGGLRDARISSSNDYEKHVKSLQRELTRSKHDAATLRSTLPFPSQSLSPRTHTHALELRGLSKQILYLKARLEREKSFRCDLSFAKEFFIMQINSFESCNEAVLALVAKLGVGPQMPRRTHQRSFKGVALAVIAISRMRLLSENWKPVIAARAAIAQSKMRMDR